MGEWITKNLCECSFDADLDTLRDFAPSTLTLGLYEADFAFCVVFLACLCISNSKYTLYLHIWRFQAQPNWRFRNWKSSVRPGHFVEQVCHPLQLSEVKHFLSCGLSNFILFNLDIFVDLGLSRRCTLHALLRLHLSLSVKHIVWTWLAFLWNQKPFLWFCEPVYRHLAITGWTERCGRKEQNTSSRWTRF